MLADMFKNMENLLINTDKAVITLLDKQEEGGMQDDSLVADFKQIERERLKHKNCLVELT